MYTLVGILLLVAATLKAWGVLHDPGLAVQEPLLGPVALPLQITGEFAFGLLTIVGLYWRKLRLVATALFVVFAGYSLILALRGFVSCGCFGPMKVNPMWTFLLDVGILGGLIADWWWGRKHLSRGSSPFPTPPEYQGGGRRTLVAIGGVSCALFLALVWQMYPTPDSANDLMQTFGDLTILEPESWAGKVFPLSEEIDLDMSQGDWVVLLHRHDCPECQAAVPQYEKLAKKDRDIHVALIEVPPYSYAQEAATSKCAIGWLTADREWFVQTPVEIRLRNGVVLSASTELPAIREDLTERRVIDDEQVQLTGFPQGGSIPSQGEQL